jgi:hypothetical protein
LNLTSIKGAVNPFLSAKIIGHQETPDSPNSEAIIDVELFDILHIKQIRISRNRLGNIITRLPNTLSKQSSYRSTQPAVWFPSPSLKVNFDAAVEIALAEYEYLAGGVK